jgi:UDP-N-acetylmuramoyl-tripeptide--D-alanyl-D-alanine ligase
VPLLLYVCAWLWRRMLYRTTFIAVSGSLGKTTTKEILGRMMATQGRTFRTWRNQNARTGVALNVLRVRPWHRYAVLEVEAGSPGSMDWPARVVAPDAAVMLCIAATHTTSYSDLDAHADEKAKLVRQMRRDGTLIANVADARVAAMASTFPGRVVAFRPLAEGSGAGTATGVDSSPAEASAWASPLCGKVAQAAWPQRLAIAVGAQRPILATDVRLESQLVGSHWAPAVLGAFTAALALGCSVEDASRALAGTPPFAGRMMPVKAPNGAVFLRDDYNASTTVLDASLEVLRQARAKRRVLVLTDFSDFGGNRRQRLKYLATHLLSCAEAFVLVGRDDGYGTRRAVEAGLPEDRVHGFAALKDAAAFLKQWTREGDLVLVKGRTTDHAARLVLAQFDNVSCWKEYCPKRMLCDICWELGPAQPRLLQIQPLSPEKTPITA